MATRGDRPSQPLRGAASHPPLAQGTSPPAAGSATLDAETIALVQSSWARVAPISDAAATLFYERLFALDPSLQSLFKSDMREQKKKLMQTLAVAVDGLRSVPRLIPVLEDLGARHAGYMVQDRHYDLVGQALLWTLREGLGDAFTPELERAWKRVYALVAGVMRRAGAAHGIDPGEETVPTQAAIARPAPVSAAVARPVAAPPAAPGAAAVAGIDDEWPSLELPADAGRVTFAPDLRPPDARTIELVQASWARVVPIADAAANLFYDRLFALDPSLEALFKSDMREQKKKLMQTLTVTVDGLRTPVKLVPVLQGLGSRHAGYMVQDRHYDLVGQALLWTLREGLGDELTPEVENAWKRVYGFVAGVMRRAVHPRAITPAPPAEGNATVHQALPGAPGEGSVRARAAAPPAPVPGAPMAAQPAGPAVASGAGVAIPVSVKDRVVDVRVSFAGVPSSAHPSAGASPGASGTALASAVLLAVTCGTLVVLGATAALFGLGMIAGATVLAPPLSYAAPIALMAASIVIFFLGFALGRRSNRRNRTERSG